MSSIEEDIQFTDLTVEEYCYKLDCWLKEFAHMNLARWKLVQNTLISVLVVYLAAKSGADPTIAVAVLALLNGVSLLDLLSLWGGNDGITVTFGQDKGTSQSAQDSSSEKSDSK